MKTTHHFASIVVPALVVCAVAGCSNTGNVHEPAAAPATATTAENGEASMSPEEFVAGQNLGSETATDPAKDVICRREKPVGSHFAKTVCVSRAEKERLAKESREFMKGMPPKSVTTSNN
jgi:hypothetical protein